MRMIGRDAIAIVPAAPERMRNNDVHYPYRQDSDFHYLTGFPEPEAVLVLMPGPRAGRIRSCSAAIAMPSARRWDGARAGPDGATRDYGADDAFPDRRHRRDPAGPDRGPRARLLPLGPRPRVRPARDRLGQSPARAGAQGRASRRRNSSRWPPPARHAPVQDARRARR